MGINVNLTPKLEELVRSKVASGQYTSVSEVVCEALRLWKNKIGLRRQSWSGFAARSAGACAVVRTRVGMLMRSSITCECADLSIPGPLKFRANPLVRADRITGGGNFWGNWQSRID